VSSAEHAERERSEVHRGGDGHDREARGDVGDEVTDGDAGPDRAHRDRAREPEREVRAVGEALGRARRRGDEPQEEQRSHCLGRLGGADADESEEHDAERAHGNASCGGDGFVERCEEQGACDRDDTHGDAGTDRGGERCRS
jgi:hypothetical protein